MPVLPAESQTFDIEVPVLIIGGGPAGMEAARGISDLGYRVILAEKRESLGGMPEHASYAALTPDFRDAGEAIGEMVAAVQSAENVDFRLGTTVTAATGQAGDFQVTLKNADPTKPSATALRTSR